MAHLTPQEPGRPWLVYVPPLLLVLLAAFTIALTKRTEENENELRRLERVRITALRAYTDLLNAETGARGYSLTGNEEYLAPFRAGSDSVMQRLDELARTTRGDPGQAAHLEKLEPIVRHRIMRLDSGVAVRRHSTIEQQLIAFPPDVGRRLMDSARFIFGEIRRDEARMIVKGEDQQRKDRQRVVWALVVGVIASGIVSWLVANKFANDATRNWMVNAELKARVEMMRSKGSGRDGETPRFTPTSNRTVD